MTQKYEGVYSQKIEKNKLLRLNIKTFNLFLVSVIAVSGIYFVAGINDLVVKGFTLQELKSKAILLKEQNDNLSIETASLQSYNSLAKRVASLNMVAVDNVDYLKVDTGVAMAR
jgi:membrane peptidoglycan carboxypeptidase